MTDVGRFNTAAIKVETSDGITFRLLEAFTFTRPVSVGGDVITILPATTSDGASVPLALQLLGLDRVDEEVLQPAFMHDAGYRGRVLVNGTPTLLPKWHVDLLFLEGMRAKGMADLKARTYFNGVSELGQKAFDEDRQQLAMAEQIQALRGQTATERQT